MAAEHLSQQSLQVHVYDAMPTVGRKFLLAGRGGLNLTHAEPYPQFLERYGDRRRQIEPLLNAFGPNDIRAWAEGLGIATFVGSSNHVFPTDMKAAPLLRAWLHRLRASGVQFHMRHRWQGWDESGTLLFHTPHGPISRTADAVVLALGGGSWPKLGSDAAWVPWLAQRGVAIAPLQPANCGFDVAWSDYFRSRFAGEPVKSVILTFADDQERPFQRQGEFVITETGVEGSLIYAVSARLREAINSHSTATFHLDLAPTHSHGYLLERLSRPRGSRSLSSHLQSRVGLKGVKMGLLRECAPPTTLENPPLLAQIIKALPVTAVAPRPIAEAISSAGGVCFSALDDRLMLTAVPGHFCAGEMLDWEAPTGGYLLTACFASGRAAAAGVLAWLGEQ